MARNISHLQPEEPKRGIMRHEMARHSSHSQSGESRIGIISRHEIWQGIVATHIVTDVPRGSVKHVRFSGEAAIQDLRERAEKILAIRESEELAEEAVRLGRMVSSDAPLY